MTDFVCVPDQKAGRTEARLLHNILVEFRTAIKLVRLIKTLWYFCFNINHACYLKITQKTKIYIVSDTGFNSVFMYEGTYHCG